MSRSVERISSLLLAYTLLWSIMAPNMDKVVRGLAEIDCVRAFLGVQQAKTTLGL